LWNITQELERNKAGGIISSFTNSFFLLAQGNSGKGQMWQVEKAVWLIQKSWLLFMLLKDKKKWKSYGK